MPNLKDVLERTLGVRVERSTPMSGGCVGNVRRVDLADGRAVVVKRGPVGTRLDIEGYMLRYLRERSDLPVPEVLHDEDTLLVMGYVDVSAGDRAGPGDAEVHAADLLASLHAIGPPQDRLAYGLDRDTLIGSLHQPNTWTESWRCFFRDHRLMHMAHEANRAGRLPGALLSRIDRLAERLDRYIDDGLADHAGPCGPSLIHGDIWSGNVLIAGGRIGAFIDPAIYHADPEIELAFITLFGTFGRRFFDRYNEHRPIREGFFDVRRNLYNLYPLLVHVRLFGGGYVSQIDGVLSGLE